MKNLFTRTVGPLFLALLCACPEAVHAQAQAFWDPSALNASPGSGGAGTWNSVSANWWVSGVGDSLWASGNIANLAGTAATVTLGAAETANGITFSTSGYTIGGSATLTLGGTTPTVSTTGSNTISCIIAGTAGLTESGSGTLVLSGVNTYTGGTTIPAGGTLQITKPGSAGNAAAPITINGNGVFTISLSAVNALTSAVSNSVSSGSSGVINMYANGFNSFVSSSLAGFNGTINIFSNSTAVGAIIVQAAGPLAASSNVTWNIGVNSTVDFSVGATRNAANVILNGGTGPGNFGALRLDSLVQGGNVLLNAPNCTIGNAGSSSTSTITGVISDNGSGYGFTRICNFNPATVNNLVLAAENTYSGPTVLGTNVLRVGSAEFPGVSGPLGKSAMVNPGSIVFAAGVLQYSSSNQFDYSGRFSTAANQAYKIDVNGQAVTFASPLTSIGGALTLSSTTAGGTLTLSGTNTYTGVTTVTSGTLNISGSVATNVMVNGGILQLSSPTALSPQAVLILPSSPSAGQVNLNFSGTQTITNLLFGGFVQAVGTWGAVGSSATFKNPAFTGTGILNVTAAPLAPQAFWDPANLDARPGSGGSGNWDTSSIDWWVTNTSDTTWPANDVANFAGSPGTVFMNNNETANGLTFSVDGYSIVPGSGNPVLTLAGIAPVITVPTNGTATIGCPIAGTAGFGESGSGTLVLTTNSTYSGTTTVLSGSALQISSAAGAGTGTIALNGISSFTVTGISGVSTTAADTIANAVTGGTNSVINLDEFTGNTFLSGSLAGFSGTINCLTGGGAAAIVIQAAGPMSIPAAATWNVGNSATLDFAAGSTDAAQVILNGAGSFGNFGALRLDNCTQAGNILLTATSDIGNAGLGTLSTVSGVISDGGMGFGVNRLGFPGTANTLVFSGHNTYSGVTTLVSNTLRVASVETPGVSGPLGASPASNPGSIVFVGGILQYSSVNQFDYSGRFSTAFVQMYNVDLNGQAVTFASALSSGAGTFNLNDSASGGVLTLSGANTYPGVTTVTNGTLKIAGSVAGNVTLLGGKLELDNASALTLTASVALPASPASGMVNLNFTGTQLISTLSFGGVLQPSGTWGAVGSGALNQSAAFIGTGILNVSGQNFYYWDANGSDAAAGTNTQGGGSGSWDGSTADWWNTGNSDVLLPTDGIAFFKGTAGTVTLNNDQTADDLTFTTSGYVITGGSTLTLGGGAPAVTIPSSGIETISCTVAGVAGLAEIGAGTLVLGGTNSYTGGTTVTAGGTLQITAGTGAGLGTVTLNGNSVFALNAVAGTVPNAVSGLSNSVINIQEAPSANTFITGSLASFNGTINCLAGGPTVSAVVEASAPLTIPANATWNVAAGATLDLNFSGHTDNATVILNGPGASANFGALRMDNCIQAGTVLLAGAGNNNQIGNAGNGTTSTISGVIIDNGLGHGLNRVGYPPFSNTIALTGENTYTGATTLSSNTLQVGSAEIPGVSGPLGKSAASHPGSIIFAGGILQFSSANQHDYSGRFATTPEQQYNIDVNGQNVTFATPLSSSVGALVLNDAAGGGKLVLSAANSFNGGTTVNAGTLDIGPSGSIVGNIFANAGTLEMDNAAAMASTGTLDMQSSATVNLNYSGTQTISGLLVNGAILPPGVYGASANNPGGFTGSGTLTVTGQPTVTISTASVANNQFTICWTSVPGINYNVYASTNLSSSTNWTLVNPSPIPGAGGTTCYTLPGNVSDQPALFLTVQE